jgi:dipeptidyl aminopeptidase/acylaminoacyl peptidase
VAANYGEFYLPFWGRGGSVAKSNHLVALATAVAGALAAVVVLGLVEVRSAEATVPGKNGKIAFQSDVGGSYEIYTMNRNGEKIKKLTTNRAPDEDPAFSPDGKRIVFRSNRDGNSDIYKMNADRTKRTRLVRLTTNPADDEDPAFSPDDKRIAFESDREGNSDIYKMTVKGRKLVQLTSDPATTFGADWAVR